MILDIILLMMVIVAVLLFDCFFSSRKQCSMGGQFCGLSGVVMAAVSLRVILSNLWHRTGEKSIEMTSPDYAPLLYGS